MIATVLLTCIVDPHEPRPVCITIKLALVRTTSTANVTSDYNTRLQRYYPTLTPTKPNVNLTAGFATESTMFHYSKHREALSGQYLH